VVEGEEMMQENNCLLLSLASGLLIAENLRTESSVVSLGVSFFGCSCNFPGSLKKKLCYWKLRSRTGYCLEFLLQTKSC
jgi:hypothetical protein